jgi:hypothetical protein
VSREPPIGSKWRILANGPPADGTRLSLHSRDYELGPHHRPTLGDHALPTQMVLDEVVLAFPGGCVHLEQMNARTWFLGIGEEKVMIHVDKDGVPRMGEWYR